MKMKKIYQIISVALIIIGLVFTGTTVLWAHGGGTTIVPQSLSVKAGSELAVTVNGLTGTKTATFKLTGNVSNRLIKPAAH